MAKKKKGFEMEGNTIHVTNTGAFVNHLQAVTDSYKAEVLPQSVIKIVKAKIKDGLFFEGEYTETIPPYDSKEYQLKCNIPIHQDMKDAFARLVPHLMFLTGYLEIPIDEMGEDDIVLYGVRGFSIGGKDEHEGVTISGYKKVEFGMVNVNTPFIKNANEDYEFIHELGEAIAACTYEVEQYLFHGKKHPEDQLELEFPLDADTTLDDSEG